MGSQTSRSNTHVANATGKNLRIYYAKHQMEEEDIRMYTYDIMMWGIKGTASKTEQSVSEELPTDVEMFFKLDSPISNTRLLKNNTCNIAGQGTIYVSVFIEDENNKEKCSKCIHHNFHVDSDRSFIVTADSLIKMQKYGANIWVDEDGKNHHP